MEHTANIASLSQHTNQHRRGILLITPPHTPKKNPKQQRRALECVVKNAQDPQVEQHLWFGDIPSIFVHRGNYLHVCEGKKRGMAGGQGARE